MIAIYVINIVFTLIVFVSPYQFVSVLICSYIILFLVSLRNHFKENEKRRAAQALVKMAAISAGVNRGPIAPNAHDLAVVSIVPNNLECFSLPIPVALPMEEQNFM